MLYLKVNNLSKTYSGKILADKISFSLSKGQKIALVAKNGAGKSTLLKILMGEVDIAEGDIQRKEGIQKKYLSQHTTFDPHKTVKEILFSSIDKNNLDDEVQLTIMINKLNLTPLLEQKYGSLSGGEAKRMALASVLSSNPDILLLDEPTNHLDLEMIEWLERHLKKQQITLLIVTHDRYFLERVCTDIIELDRGRIFSYPGNYSYFLEKKAIREENEKIEAHKLKQLLRKELSWMRKSPQGRGTKSTYREEKFYEIQNEYQQKKEALIDREASLDLAIQERRLGGKILKINNLKKSFGEKTIVENFSHEFKHGERIGIIGKNGVGKSTFINLISEKIPADGGNITTGETVVLGHYEQKEIIFHHEQRVKDVVNDSALLERFLFPTSMQHTFANLLSGGEKRRLYLLTILMKNPNFLILDEPTNDLDLITLGVLEEFLLTYNGCLIVISHDRFFMDKIVDHLFIFEGNGIIKDFWGSYSEFKEQQKLFSRKENTAKKEKEETSTSSGTQKSLSYMEKRELEILVGDIEKLENRKEEIETLFNNPHLSTEEIHELSSEIGNILDQLKAKEDRWFELNDG